MHRKPLPMIKFCLEKATQCRLGADQVREPERQRSWLELEGQWFYLARSYENEHRAAVQQSGIGWAEDGEEPLDDDFSPPRRRRSGSGNQ
jgi:hypothetical protein